MATVDSSSFRNSRIDGNHLIIPKALKNSQGAYYDISIGIESNRSGADLSELPLQLLVPQIAGFAEKILASLKNNGLYRENLAELGFRVERGSRDSASKTTVLVANAGESVLAYLQNPSTGGIESTLDESTLDQPSFLLTWQNAAREDEVRPETVHQGLVRISELFGLHSLISVPKCQMLSPVRDDEDISLVFNPASPPIRRDLPARTPRKAPPLLQVNGDLYDKRIKLLKDVWEEFQREHREHSELHSPSWEEFLQDESESAALRKELYKKWEARAGELVKDLPQETDLAIALYERLKHVEIINAKDPEAYEKFLLRKYLINPIEGNWLGKYSPDSRVLYGAL